MEKLEALIVERHGRVALIKFNRPQDANCLNVTMASELAWVAARCDADPQVSAVVLTGTGRFFSAGGDVKMMSGFGADTPIMMKRVADELHKAISTFARMQAPLIVAVNGVAAGAGFSMAAIGDLVVASKDAMFMMAYTANGLSPDGSSSYYLPRLIGLRRTQELMLTNRKLSAAQAMEMGVVTRVCEPDKVLEEAMALAQACATGSREANAAVKALLLSTFSNSLETQMEVEGRLIAHCASTPNGQEGIRAFVDKRKPAFK